MLLHTMQGMPKGLILPELFGMYIRLSGLGWYPRCWRRPMAFAFWLDMVQISPSTPELLQAQVLVEYRWQNTGLGPDCSVPTATYATSCRNPPNRTGAFQRIRLSSNRGVMAPSVNVIYASSSEDALHEGHHGRFGRAPTSCDDVQP